MKKDHLSYSQISVFNNCKQEYQYKYVQKLRPNRDSNALWYGKYFHRGMELLYKHKDPIVALTAVMEEIQSINMDSFSDEEMKDLYWMQNVLEAHVMGYYDHFYVPDMENGYTVVELEKQYTIPIIKPSVGGRTYKSRRFNFTFTADGVMRDRNGKLVMLEYKTTSRFGDAYFDRLSFDEQITGNMAGLEMIYKEPIDRVLYRVMKKPSIRQRKDESELQYMNRLTALFQEEAGNYFVEDIQRRTKDEIEDFKRRLWITQQDITFVRRNNLYTRNTSSCVLRGCRYMALCANKPNARDQFIEHDNVVADVYTGEEVE